MNKNNTKKTERRVQDTLLYAFIIQVLLYDTPTVNGVPVSEAVRLTAINDELANLLSAIGISKQKFQDYIDNADQSETSPAQREFNNILERAIEQVLNSQGSD